MASPDLALPATRTAPTVPDLWRGLLALSLALAATMLLWALSGESRLIDGVPVWSKPLKFALSFAVLFATIALVLGRLSPPVREGWSLRLTGLVMGTALIAEMGWIILQAARGTGSHYNLATPLEAFMYTAVMGGGAVSLVVSVGLIGWIVRRDRAARLGAGLREGVWLGFLSSFVLTLIIAGYLSAGTGPHVGTHPDGAPALPLVGWSGVTGDLRPAHFLALHAMQALPLVGLWLDRRGTASAVRIVRLSALGWAALTVAVFLQALAGRPLLAL